MELTIVNERENTTKTILFRGKTVQDLLSRLKLNPETVLIVRNSEVLTQDEVLKSKDVLHILSVVSGG